MGIIIVYVTHENLKEAQKIGDSLLNKKLIACANYLPIQATYMWNGAIESGDEIVSLLKTRKEHWENIKKEIENIHPYDLPCIIKIEVEANKKYEQWIYDETKK